MNNINYKTTQKYWDERLAKDHLFRFSAGYVMPSKLENVAFYRFKKEVFFLNKLINSSNGRYLDLGCGAGNYLNYFSNRFEKLIGIYFSSQLLEIARMQCNNFKNVEIYNDNVLNFEKYIKEGKKFNFIFIGGVFMYLNDEDVTYLINQSFNILENGGIMVFREPTVTKKRINEKDIGTRRTITEYSRLIKIDKEKYELETFQNYSVNYTHFIGLYLKIFPCLKNNVSIFNNYLIEFLFLYLPLSLYTKIKEDMVLYHFFVIKKK